MAITVETLQFAARDGRPLTGSLHIPPVSNRRAVLINSALGTPRARYDAFARFLAEAGFSVLSYDNRGIGGSRTAVGDADRVRLRQWGETDLPAALDCLAARLPEARQFAVGHATGDGCSVSRRTWASCRASSRSRPAPPIAATRAAWPGSGWRWPVT